MYGFYLDDSRLFLPASPLVSMLTADNTQTVNGKTVLALTVSGLNRENAQTILLTNATIGMLVKYLINVSEEIE